MFDNICYKMAGSLQFLQHQRIVSSKAILCTLCVQLHFLIVNEIQIIIFLFTVDDAKYLYHDGTSWKFGNVSNLKPEKFENLLFCTTCGQVNIYSLACCGCQWPCRPLECCSLQKISQISNLVCTAPIFGRNGTCEITQYNLIFSALLLHWGSCSDHSGHTWWLAMPEVQVVPELSPGKPGRPLSLVWRLWRGLPRALPSTSDGLHSEKWVEMQG